MQAWYYHRGQLTEIEGEHPGPVAAIYKGKARVRFHEDSGTLAVQARSLRIVRAAVAAVLDLGDVRPERIDAEWPGHYRSDWIQDWR